MHIGRAAWMHTHVHSSVSYSQDIACLPPISF